MNQEVQEPVNIPGFAVCQGGIADWRRAFPPTAVQESFTIITLSKVWGGIKSNITDLESHKCASPLLCGPGDGFSIFYFSFHLTNGTCRITSKNVEAVKSGTQTFDSSNLPF